MRIKYLKRYIAFIITMALPFHTGMERVSAREKATPEAQTYTANKVRDMYNMLIPIRFDGEDEYLNDKIMQTNDITNIELIDNTYNKSEYSVQEYYRAVSNHTLNLKTVYLTENDNEFTSVKLKHSRGYYSPKTEENPEGYTTDMEYRRSELLRDWSDKVQEAINSGAKLKNIAGDEINFDKLDSDNDSYIDAITLLFTPTDAKYAGSGDGGTTPLWAYQTVNNLINIKTDKGILTSNRYYQAPIQNDPVSIYKEKGSDIYFANDKTLIHEMGHIFGLLDLYASSGGKEPVYFMSAMAKALSPVVQFMTSREREAVGWLDADNITPITKAGEYTLPPTKDKRQDGTVAYTLELPNNHKLYLEYRYVDDGEINRFDLAPKNHKIYNSLGNYVSASGLNKSGLLVCDANMSVKFPRNSSGVTQLSAIGGQYNTRIDAPMAEGEDITYGGYTISVTKLTKEKITFKVSGKEMNGEQPTEQPGNDGKPTANGVTLLAPSEVGENLQMTAARGSQIQFLAQINGKKISDGDIRWTVRGETAADTEIDYETGLLKIGAFESTASVLQIVGKSEKDDEKAITIKVNVTLGTKIYSVTYFPGSDAVGSIDSVNKLHDTTLALKAASYTKTGYTQTGWSLSEGSEKVYDLKGEYKENKAIILYPYWSKAEQPTEKPTEKPIATPSAEPSQTEKPTATPSAEPSQPEKPVATPSAEPSQTEKPVATPSAAPSQPEKPTASSSVAPNQPEKPTTTSSAAPSQPEKPTTTSSAEPSQTEKPTTSSSAAPNQPEKPAATSSAAPSQTEKPIDTPVASPGIEPTATPNPTVSPKPIIKLNKTSVVLYLPKNTTTTLKARLYGESVKVKFKSSNPKVVKVNAAGKLTAVKNGKANIKVTANGQTAICKVTVRKTLLKLDQTKSTIYLNEKRSIRITAMVVGPNKRIIYKSSNKKVVKVSRGGKVTAVGKGTADITVISNGIKKKCRVTVLTRKTKKHKR